jgi:hypothetical protein
MASSHSPKAAAARLARQRNGQDAGNSAALGGAAAGQVFQDGCGWERGGRSFARPACARVDAAKTRSLSSEHVADFCMRRCIVLNMRGKFFCSQSGTETTPFTDNTSHSPMILC